MEQDPKNNELPEEVSAIRKEIGKFFDRLDEKNRKIGSSTHGVYAFFDYDQEPIYVGQTYEKIRGRVGRHLTNQRTDAVAMNVLDPFEVAEIEIWPLDDAIQSLPATVSKKEYLDKAEYTVFCQVLKKSFLGAVLNEKQVIETEIIELPKSYRQKIIPDSLFESRKHPDVRLARRASTIANLARVISERSVSKGLRRTLLTQARRLELLASRRLEELGIEDPRKECDKQKDD
jgi:hypothetical protein